ncbi:hypothetical protein GH714_043100 [Hevea brasiliensis]|uniref:Reverse transcriptase domain-containing protein n=1 Tax=Hevea brasiliensis TaxID=3981 RepID=A0A6A6K5Y8_HEVBR|nr:hypothetical protein GH714_043100 [Hevea brasiliensis]
MQEAVQSMEKMKGRKEYMAFKIDLAKAYDKLSWSFVFDTLRDASFPSPIVNMIMFCITLANFRVLWNGKPSFERCEGKYASRVVGIPSVLNASRGTPVWRAIASAWPLVHSNLSWLVR